MRIKKRQVGASNWVVTEKMIKAAAKELAAFDTDYGTIREAAERILNAALEASSHG